MPKVHSDRQYLLGNLPKKAGEIVARPSPTVRRRRLRYELRRLRTERGLTIEEVQERSNGDIKAPTLSRWETGERSIRPVDLRLLLDIYDLPADDRESLLTLARQARERGWWHPYASAVPDWFQVYVGLETEASTISEYAAELVPGLLQTEGYYRAFLASVAPGDPEIDKKVKVRLERQDRLTNGDAPNYWAVLNEAVIRRPVGGGEVMDLQLEHVVAVAELPNVTIQVLPFSAGVHPAMDGSYSILGFPGPHDPDVVYQENQSGSVYLEEAGQAERFGQTFSHLIAKALSPEDSARLIREVAAGL
jgi:transcriptional regulator with XRE-family HTH domain